VIDPGNINENEFSNMMKTNDKFGHIEEYEDYKDKDPSPYYNQDTVVGLEDIKNYQQTPPSKRHSRDYSRLKGLQTPVTRKSLRTGATQKVRGGSLGSRGPPSLFEGSTSIVQSLAF
jgi:hypothetical protein